MRQPEKVIHSVGKLIKQRVFGLMHGYPDVNDAEHLAEDPLYRGILRAGGLASQPTASRLENLHGPGHDLEPVPGTGGPLDRHTGGPDGAAPSTSTIPTTRPTAASSCRCSMGFYGRKVDSEPRFHERQIPRRSSCPALRPGNAHSSRWRHAGILRRIRWN
ncbi:MAG: transposase [Balneolaceae bacterium]|nr:transposase [Balneolaceae bacterium]